MQLSQAAMGYLEDLRRTPAARQPATLGEIWDSEWKRGGLDTITGIGEPLRAATDDLRNAITNAAGKPLEDYAAERGVVLGAGATVDQRIKALRDLADTLPEEHRKTIEPLLDVRRRAAANAQKIEREAAEVSASTYGIGGIATSWAAGVARQTSDPINLAMMAVTAPIGGPVTGPAAKFIGGQFVAGAVSQAAVEPYVQPARAELGLEAGFGRAATNILEAGVGGAVLGAAGLGLHRLFRAAADSHRAVSPTMEATQPPAAQTLTPESASPIMGRPDIGPEDFDALALHAERDAVTSAPPDADPVLHAEQLARTTRAMEEGRPLARPDTEPVIEPSPTVPVQEDLPLRPPQPIEPKGPTPVEAKEKPEIIGDPVLAQDVERRLAQMPEADLIVNIERPDKSIGEGSARTFLREIEDEARAARELIDCIGQEPK